MLERPNLPDDCIITALRDSYDLSVSAINFLPIGNDTTAWVYRVEAGDDAYFLKVRRGAVNEASLLVPHFLRDQGIEQVLAPCPTQTQHLYAPLKPFNLIRLYRKQFLLP